MGDWRLLKGQEQYLKGVSLVFQEYSPADSSNDHDHCEFCMGKFGFGLSDLHVGYSTLNKYHWICEECFNDFQSQFDWQVINRPCNNQSD